MRQRRIKVVGQSAVYHCITRCVGGMFLLDEDECKEVLRKQIHRVARFCGVEILTYCVMSNHFHVLVRVPLREGSNLSVEELLKRCEAIYGEDELAMLQWKNRLENPEKREHYRKLLLARMGDVSVYMKELKQRFSTWYNRTHDRYGTLWAERFKSVIVENVQAALSMVAAYIDLNPVRAGLVEDPKDYRFCGYSETLAKGKSSGLVVSVFGNSNFNRDQALNEYRKLLYGMGFKPKHLGGEALDPAKVRSILEGETLKKHELLRHRVRYFTDGAVLGSKSFVKATFQSNEHCFTNRKGGSARLIPFEGNDSLGVLRNLRNVPVD